MHWALVRLLRLAPDALDATAARALLDEHLTPAALATETAYLERRPGFERPYGWGWLLTLYAELQNWDDPDAARWAEAVRPLATHVACALVAWLPRVGQPTRDGTHMNSAFALTRALTYDDAELRAAVTAAARRWYGADQNYPAAWEPGAADFLSAALTEAELMATVLEPDEFGPWFGAFLPGLAAGHPRSLLTPVEVIDPTDGQGAHLYGLNLYRAYAFTRLEAVLPAEDPRRPVLVAAAREHTEAALPAVVGGGWMAEHWLAAYAVLLLTA